MWNSCVKLQLTNQTGFFTLSSAIDSMNMSDFSTLTSGYLQCWISAFGQYTTYTIHTVSFEVLVEHLFFSVPIWIHCFFPLLRVCVLCVCVYVCVWFMAVYIANSGWALFNKPYLWESGVLKPYKMWMKAEAKLIKFNRIKMWLVTQRSIKNCPPKQPVFMSSWP